MRNRVCHSCGTHCRSFCPTCVAAFPTRRDATTMTAQERATALLQLGGPLEIPFRLVHQRVQELVGRSVWTHELADPDALVAEIRRGEPIGFGEVIGKLDGKPRIIIVADDGV